MNTACGTIKASLITELSHTSYLNRLKKIPPYIEYNVYNGTLGLNLGGVSPLITDQPPTSSIPLSIFLYLFVIISKKSLNKYIKENIIIGGGEHCLNISGP